jgi:AP2-associated kinase
VKFPVVDSSSSSLEVPSPEPRSQRTTRRTSISNMVQRYEAMSGSAAPSPVSRPPNSPAQPAVSLTRSHTTHVSPSSRRGHLGAVGLPGLATDPSKKPPTGGASDKLRAEHASPVGLPGLAAEGKPPPSFSGRRSPMKFDATGGAGGSGAGGLDVPVKPIPRRAISPVNPAAQGGEEAQPPPSPERPYQGVGRLIDEWQRKTADAEVPRSPVSRRRGGGGGAGTGATASPRRAGVIAGRGTQD